MSPSDQWGSSTEHRSLMSTLDGIMSRVLMFLRCLGRWESNYRALSKTKTLAADNKIAESDKLTPEAHWKMSLQVWWELFSLLMSFFFFRPDPRGEISGHDSHAERRESQTGLQNQEHCDQGNWDPLEKGRPGHLRAPGQIQNQSQEVRLYLHVFTMFLSLDTRFELSLRPVKSIWSLCHQVPAPNCHCLPRQLKLSPRPMGQS